MPFLTKKDYAYNNFKIANMARSIEYCDHESQSLKSKYQGFPEKFMSPRFSVLRVGRSVQSLIITSPRSIAFKWCNIRVDYTDSCPRGI